MLVTCLLGMLLNLTLCSVSDRYRAHRLVYICLLICTLLVGSALIIPILFHGYYSRSATIQQDTQPTLSNSSLDNLDNLEQVTLDDDWPWFWGIAVCVSAATVFVEILYNFGESYSANIATLCHKSYGSIRFWGSIGWCAAALVSYLASNASNFSDNLPYLTTEFGLFTILTAFNLLVVLLWPDKRPFDLSPENIVKPSARNLFKNTTADTIEPNNMHVTLTSLTNWPAFDSREDDQTDRNVRRCSLAKLENSDYILQQFELDSKKLNNSPFKFVTKIVFNPGQLEMGGFGEKKDNLPPKKIQFEEDTTNREKKVGGILALRLNEEKKAQFYTVQVPGAPTRKETLVGFWAHLDKIKVIAKNDPNMIRFMFLYFIIGLVSAQNSVFLLSYLEYLDEDKAHHLISMALISGAMSETLFYSISSKVVSKVSYSVGLSTVLFMYALRYTLYLMCSYQPENFPMETIILIELLQAPSMGWFNCIFSDAPQHFADNFNRLSEMASKPPDVRKGIQLHRATIASPKEKGECNLDSVSFGKNHVNEVKLTLLSLSSCCFDGLGIALGSLVGGWLINSYSFQHLWISIIALSLTIGLLNIITNLGSNFCFKKNIKS